MSAGLFHRVILQSGSALAPWALQRARAGAEAAAELARELGHDVAASDLPRLHEVLLDATTAQLLATPTPRRAGRVLLEHLPYVPCIENRIDGVEAFLAESPLDILSRGDQNRVPTIVGATAEEGSFFAAMEDDETMVAPSWERKLPAGLRFPTARARVAAAWAVRRAYGGVGEWRGVGGAAAVRRRARMYGDAYFGFPARAEAALLARGAPVYAYRLARAGWRDLATLRCGPRYWRRTRAATHADDLFYLFRVFPLPAWLDATHVDALVTYWTDFAKYGDPNGPAGGPWPPVLPGMPLALRIHSTPRVEPLWHSASLRLWRRLYRQYGAH